MKESSLKKVIILVSLILISFFISSNSQEEENQFISQVLAQPSPFPTQQIAPLCQSYKNLTSIFQNRGLPSKFSTFSVDQTTQQHMSLFIYNQVSNVSQIYLYDLGNDSLLNTSDDRSFLIENISLIYMPNYLAPIMSGQQNNNETLYWVKYTFNGLKIIKSCRISPQGCSNISTITTLDRFTRLQTIMPSITQDRIFLAYKDFPRYYQDSTSPVTIPETSTYASCKIQQGHQDSCINSILNYTIHSNFSEYYYKSLDKIGFISLIRPDPGYLRVFDMNLPNPGVVVTNISVINIDLIYSSGFSPALFAIQPSLNSTINSTEDLVIMDTSTSFVGLIDLLDFQLSDQEPLPLVKLTSSANILIYRSMNNEIIGENVGGSAKPIYTYSSGESDIFPKMVLQDKSVIGIIPEKYMAIEFECKV